MYNKNKLLATALIVTLTSFAASNSHARIIIGEIGFGGTIIPLTGAGGTPTNLGAADALDFTAAVVTSSTGDFLPLTSGTPATFTDFVIDPFTGPIDPLWTAGAFSFSLGTNLTISSQSDTGLVLTGSGTVKSTIAGLDDTPGSWHFSGNPVGGGSFVFSAGSAGGATVNPVPEPSSIALLALGLVGFAVIRRTRK